MQTENTVSITLPPDLLVKAQALAEQERRTISELMGEALRKYIQRDAEWDALLERTRAKGRELGITDEGSVELLSDQYRREKQ
jgi:predicted transcriptional regulator